MEQVWASLVDRFPVPERRLDPDQVLPLDLDDWLQELPVADSRATGRKILELVQHLNRCPLEYERRLQMLETLEPAGRQALNGMVSSLGRLALMPMTEGLKRIEAIMRLHYELALGYRILLEGVDPAIPYEKAEKLWIALVLSRCLAHLADCLRLYYLTHIKPKSKVWSQVMILYACARHLDIDDLAGDAMAWEQPAGILRSLLLLRVCSPHTLRMDEQIELRRQIAGLRDLVRLERPTESPHQGQVCFFGEPDQPETGVLLDLGPLLLLLQERLEQDEEPPVVLESGLELTYQAALNLLSRLTMQGRCSGARKTGRGEIEMVAGLPDILRALDIDHQPPAAAPVQTTPGWEVLDLGPLNAPMPRTAPIDLVPRADRDPPRTGRKFRRALVRILNYSGQGFRLLLPRDLAFPLEVGELLALREPGAQRWMIGTVRWLVGAKEEWHLGVYLLAAVAERAQIGSIDGETLATPVGGLLLLRDARSTQPDRLLIPRGQLQEASNCAFQWHQRPHLAVAANVTPLTREVDEVRMRSFHAMETPVPRGTDQRGRVTNTRLTPGGRS